MPGEGAARIAVVEDERLFQEILATKLTDEGYEVITFDRGHDFLKAEERENFDIVLLDIGLPDESGVVIARQLRARSDIPIIMLTADADEKTRISCLEVGADDYLLKNITKEELKLRLRNMLRRTRAQSGAGPAQKELCHIRGWTLDLENYRAFNSANEEAELTVHEFNTLKLLHQAKGRILARGQILDGLNGGTDDAPSDRMVDALVSRIRKKLGDSGVITTVQGLGYRLNINS